MVRVSSLGSGMAKGQDLEVANCGALNCESKAVVKWPFILRSTVSHHEKKGGPGRTDSRGQRQEGVGGEWSLWSRQPSSSRGFFNASNDICTVRETKSSGGAGLKDPCDGPCK
jgi:hypothetical protein